MLEVVGIVMIVILTAGAGLFINRVLNYMKNNHYCDKIYAEG